MVSWSVIGLCVRMSLDNTWLGLLVINRSRRLEELLVSLVGADIVCERSRVFNIWQNVFDKRLFCRRLMLKSPPRIKVLNFWLSMDWWSVSKSSNQLLLEFGGLYKTPTIRLELVILLLTLIRRCSNDLGRFVESLCSLLY